MTSFTEQGAYACVFRLTEDAVIVGGTFWFQDTECSAVSLPRLILDDGDVLPVGTPGKLELFENDVGIVIIAWERAAIIRRERNVAFNSECFL